MLKTILISCLLVLTSTAFADTNKDAAKKTMKKDTVEAPQVSLKEFKKLVKKEEAVIIDANGDDMYKNGHVPGAISYAAHQGELKKVLPDDKKALLVAYCGGPMCTAWEFAAKEAKKLGYTNVKHYKGGIKGWKKAGLPVEKVKDKKS